MPRETLLSREGIFFLRRMPEAEACGILGEFHGRNGEKYRKYRQAIQYIRRFGYPAFFAVADGWKDAKGKYPVLK